MIEARMYKCLKSQRMDLGQFTLKTIQDDDIEDIRNWRNSQIDVLRQSEPISQKQQKNYFEQKIWPAMKLEYPDNILFTFFEKDKKIGYGGLVHISWEHRRAEVSFLLNTAYTRDNDTYCHYFSIYLSMIKTLAFSALKFNRLYTETYDFRHEHIKALESNKFQLEGRMRKHILICDKFYDSVIHGVTNEK